MSHFWVGLVKLGLGFDRERPERRERKKVENDGIRILILLYKLVDRVGFDPVHFPFV